MTCHLKHQILGKVGKAGYEERFILIYWMHHWQKMML
jgi:hypothetical protein